MPVKSPGVPPGLANARPPGHAKLAKVPPPGLTRLANAPQLPGGGGGGWAQVELTDALTTAKSGCTIITQVFCICIIASNPSGQKKRVGKVLSSMLLK